MDYSKLIQISSAARVPQGAPTPGVADGTIAGGSMLSVAWGTGDPITRLRTLPAEAAERDRGAWYARSAERREPRLGETPDLFFVIGNGVTWIGGCLVGLVIAVNVVRAIVAHVAP